MESRPHANEGGFWDPKTVLKIYHESTSYKSMGFNNCSTQWKPQPYFLSISTSADGTYPCTSQIQRNLMVYLRGC
jgi:hypothetical protein